MESVEMSTPPENKVQTHGDNVAVMEKSEVSSRRWQRQAEDEEPETLEPDHPLMKRFQASLREHLLRQNARLTEEVLELSAGLKAKQRERQASADELFNVEQEVNRQHGQLADCNEKLATLASLRDEMDALVSDVKMTYQSENQLLVDTNARETQLQAELERVSMAETQLRTWAEQTESGLGVTQRMSEKARLDKKQLAAEKRKQDWVVLRLQQEVSRLEGELLALDRKLRDKEVERDRVAQSAREADTELQRMNGEQNRLLQAWSRVVVAVTARDKVHATLQEQLGVMQADLATICCEVEGAKRAGAQEQLTNQELTSALQRVEAEVAALQHNANIEEEAKAGLELKLSELAAALDCTEQDLATLLTEAALKEAELASERKQAERVQSEKRATEDLLLIDIQERLTTDKAAGYTGKLITRLRDSIRQQELSLVEAESALTAAMLAMEQQDGGNQSASMLLAELQNELVNEEAALAVINNDLRQAKFAASSRLAGIEVLHKRLELLVEKAGGIELSPAQVKIAGLESALRDANTKCINLQQYWLRREGLTVQLAQQRNAQLAQIDMARKQLSILEQKSLQLERSLEEQATEEQATVRATEELMHRLQVLNLQLSQALGCHTELNQETRVKQAQYLDTLKECEMQWLQMESELNQLDEEKLELSEQLIAAQRHCMTLEGQCKMAAEARLELEKEGRVDGEVGTMRAEIHRMQVRYSQLRRAQEKLAADLDHCVSRRDAIVDQSEARDRRAGASRKQWNSRLNELRLKLANNQARTRQAQVELRKAETVIEELREQLAERHIALEATQEATNEEEVRLEEAQLRRHCNLAQLVRRQNKVRQYSGIKQGTHRLLFKSELDLQAENHKQRSINSDLISVLEASVADFPALRPALDRILAMLRLPPS